MMTQNRIYVGIDVSKARLDVAVSESDAFAVANDVDGIAALIERLSPLRPVAIGLEASGGYERRALKMLQAAGLPVRRIDSWRLRQFAKAQGVRAKTDPIDAAMTLLAEVPELGHLGPKQIAALVGVAPYTHRSGTIRRHAAIQGGRCHPRAALFIAALTQIRYQPWARLFLQRLTSRGKPKMIAVALMRKLVVALNAMLKEDRYWQQPQST